jgi:bifunctional UDP-N-acetylglucosamine pyrophosphorylase/glucosamine-1-phosphate N-acetyltransferase
VNKPISVLILAAGLGTRMKSSRAKVLHRLGGSPLIAHVVRTAALLNPENIGVVVGHQAEEVSAAARESVRDLDESLAKRLTFVTQAEQRGTGHAVGCAREMLKTSTGPVVVIYGDAPLVRLETLTQLLAEHERGGHGATLITTRLANPTGYGRIIRNAETRSFERIIEERDSTPEQRQITEINPGFYCFDAPGLLESLDGLTSHNVQGEYYLTDVPELMLRGGRSVGTIFHEPAEELLGINTRAELASAWKRLRHAVLDDLMREGVTIVDPESTYIDPGITIGADTIIHPQVIIEGSSRIGRNCEIHSWSRLTSVEIGDDCQVLNGCRIVNCRLTARNSVGPFAHLRMNAELAEDAVVGNFVEVKKSSLGRRTKAMHLTYLGDATLGDRVNIGAGTVTCNYDGKQKHPTFIEDDVKIGSDTMLVAPVRVGRGSVSGAGSVITRDVPPDSLVAGVPAQIKKRLKD